MAAHVSKSALKQASHDSPAVSMHGVYILVKHTLAAVVTLN